MKTFFLLFFPLLLLANPPPFFPSDGKICVQNAILAKVRDTTISVLDVKKKMDLIFAKAYPKLLSSPAARVEFYKASWKEVLKELINNQLMLAEAEAKELKLPNAEVREEMQDRFGPNVIAKLEEIGLTYDEAWKLLREEILVQKLSWYFIHSKAIQSVTPEVIRNAYIVHCKKNPPKEEWNFDLLTINSDDPEIAKEVATRAHSLISTTKEALASSYEAVLALEKSYPAKISLSKDLCIEDKDLSPSYKKALLDLTINGVSAPLLQMTNDRKFVHRIFHLKDRKKTAPPSFEELSSSLKNELLNKAVAKESDLYFHKLRIFYGIEEKQLKELLPESFEPFSLE